MKTIFLSLLILALSAPMAIAQACDPLTGQPCPVGGSPFVGRIIQDQMFGTDSINSNAGSYTPKTEPFVPPPSTPVVAPNFNTNYANTNYSVPNNYNNSGYNNFGNYNSYPYGNGYDNTAAAGALVGAAAFASVVTTVKVSKFFLHKLSSNHRERERYKSPKPHQIDISKLDLPSGNNTGDLAKQLEDIKTQLVQKYPKLISEIN